MDKTLISPKHKTFSSEMANAHQYNRWVLSMFQPYIASSLLEVGVGHGEFYQLIEGLSDYAGVDIDEDLLQAARIKYPQQNYFHGDIVASNFAASLDGKKFNAVLCINVLEHVEKDKKALENMLSVLNPGGHLLLFVPAFQLLYNDLDKLAGHYRRYTKKTLANIVPATTKIIKLEYFNPIGGLGWWANKFCSHQSLDDSMVNSQISFFEKFILPVSKMLNGFTKNFFGQSLICVLEN